MKDENASDWFDFFDNRAFADHQDWKGCYCTGPFMPRLKEYDSKSPIRKEYAKWLVENGMMKGYLAYENGKVIGWCNVNMKSALPKYNRVVKDAQEKGIKIIEAYPRIKAQTEYGNFHGAYSMYEKNGFVLEKIKGVDVVRKYL
jgi:hypothetical protein